MNIRLLVSPYKIKGETWGMYIYFNMRIFECMMKAANHKKEL